jgi:hypothetical protein
MGASYTSGCLDTLPWQSSLARYARIVLTGVTPAVALYTDSACTAGKYSLGNPLVSCNAVSTASLAVLSGFGCPVGATSFVVSGSDTRYASVVVLPAATEQLLAVTFATGSKYNFLLAAPLSTATAAYAYTGLSTLVTGCMRVTLTGTYAWSYLSVNFATRYAAVYSDSACSTLTFAIASATGSFSATAGWGTMSLASNGRSAFSGGLTPTGSSQITYFGAQIVFGASVAVTSFTEAPVGFYQFTISVPCAAGTYAATDKQSCVACPAGKISAAGSTASTQCVVPPLPPPPSPPPPPPSPPLPPAPPPPTWMYQGCWNDINTAPRLLPNALTSAETTLANCQTLATNGGYDTIGLQYGGQCMACLGCDFTQRGSAPISTCSRPGYSADLGGSYTNQCVPPSSCPGPAAGAYQRMLSDPLPAPGSTSA